MKDKKKRRVLGIVSVLAAIIIGGAVGTWAFCENAWDTAAAESGAGTGEYPLQEAVAEAATIVYGTVLEKQKGDDFTQVIVEVTEAVKGAEDTEKITYMEADASVWERISKKSAEKVKVGKKYIFFLDEQGKSLSASTVVPVKSGKAAINGYLELRCFWNAETEVDQGIPVDIYIGVIQHEYLKWQEEMGYAHVMWVRDALDMFNEHATEIFYGRILELSENSLDSIVKTDKIRVEVLEGLKGIGHFQENTPLYWELEPDYQNKDMKKDEEGIFWIYEEKVVMWLPTTNGYVFIPHSKETEDGIVYGSFIFTKEQLLEVMREAVRKEPVAGM